MNFSIYYICWSFLFEWCVVIYLKDYEDVLPAKACTTYEHRFKLSKKSKFRIFFMVIWLDVFLILEHIKISRFLKDS